MLIFVPLILTRPDALLFRYIRCRLNCCVSALICFVICDDDVFSRHVNQRYYFYLKTVHLLQKHALSISLFDRSTLFITTIVTIYFPQIYSSGVNCFILIQSLFCSPLWLLLKLLNAL